MSRVQLEWTGWVDEWVGLGRVESSIINILYYISKKMFRAIPMSNKLCFDKDVKRSWKIHEAKLNNLKSRVGKDRPEKF